MLVAGSIAIDVSCDYRPLLGASEKRTPQPHTSNPAIISQSMGGVGFNIVQAAVSTGAQVQLCSMVANDMAGKNATHSLERLGLDTSSIIKITGDGMNTAQYVSMNDTSKDLVMAMADMSIMENRSNDFQEVWLPKIRSLEHARKADPDRVRWLVVDANWDALTLHQWINAARTSGIAIAFEPVSTAKSVRLFAAPFKYNLPCMVDVATPNTFELIAMHDAAKEAGLLERRDWWQTIDALGIPSSGARAEILRVTGRELVDQGIPQRSIQLLPFVPNLLTTLGPHGVLLTKILLVEDRALTNPESAPFIIARSNSDGPIGGLYMRLFPPLKMLSGDDISSVNGAGDAFLGALVGTLAQAKNPMIEDAVDVAQAASLEVLNGKRKLFQ